MHGVDGFKFGLQANVSVGITESAVAVADDGIDYRPGNLRLNFQQSGVAGMPLAVGAQLPDACPLNHLGEFAVKAIKTVLAETIPGGGEECFQNW